MIPITLFIADVKRFWAGILTLILLIGASTALTTVVNLQERALRIGSARAAESFDLIIGAPGSEAQLVLSSVFLQPANLPLLPIHYLRELNENPAVAWSAPVAFGDSYKGMPVVGTRIEMVTEGGSRKLAQGKPFQNRFDAVVGSNTGLKIGDTFTPIHGQIMQGGSHQHSNAAYRVVGVLPELNTSWDRAILVPIESVWHIHGLAEDEALSNDDVGLSHHEPGASAIIVKPKTIAGAYQLRSQYRTANTLAVFPAEVLTWLYATLGDVHGILNGISLGTQFLLAVSIALIGLVHLHQRKKQIAALRAFGAPRYAIFTLIWLGILMLVSLGILTGIGVGYIITCEISDYISAKSGFSMPVNFTQRDGKNALILVLSASAIATVPALAAFRISPAQALRR